jgi:hypothetical protein
MGGFSPFCSLLAVPAVCHKKTPVITPMLENKYNIEEIVF